MSDDLIKGILHWGLKMASTLIHEKIKGQLGQYEDWWHLHKSNDGDMTVVHSWSHTTVRNLTSKSGENKYSLSDFLDGDHDEIIKQKIKKLL